MLRKNPVNILRYLPEFIAKDDLFRATGNALSAEHEQMRLTILDVCRQFFLDTATWGLSRWEEIYQTEPPPGASYELRRSLIRAKKLAYPSITVDRLEKIANSFIYSGDEKITIREMNRVYSFALVLPLKCGFWYQEMRNAIADIRPAHLDFFAMIATDMLKFSHCGPVIKTVRDLSYDEFRQHTVFDVGFGAAGKLETKKQVTETVWRTTSNLFKGAGTLGGGMHFGCAGKKFETVERCEVYKGERTIESFEGATIGSKTFTLSRCGVTEKVLRDLGRDETVEAVLFEGGVLGGRASVTFGNAARHAEMQTAHFPDWRTVIVAKNAAVLSNAEKKVKKESVYETVETRRKQHAGQTFSECLSEKRIDTKTEREEKTHNTLRAQYAFSRCGIVEKTLEDIGKDKIVHTVLFTGAAFGCAPLHCKEKIEKKTTKRREKHFAGGAFGGRGRLVFSEAPGEIKIVEEYKETSLRIARFCGAFTFGGRKTIANAEKHIETRIEHFPDWRVIQKTKNASLFSAAAHGEYTETIRHEKFEIRKHYDSETAHTLGGKRGIGYMILK